MIKNKKEAKAAPAQVGFRLDPQTYEKLTALAHEQRRPVGQLCRIIVEDFLSQDQKKSEAA